MCMVFVSLVCVCQFGCGVRRFVGCRDCGEVFRCDLCDPCMMLSCAFILVKKKSWLELNPCSKDLWVGHYSFPSSLALALHEWEAKEDVGSLLDVINGGRENEFGKC